mmetsp:Transcript_21724/g.48011  ORF Transcript_21724/g.48011 Transcript_21724/m.48011 type:complete len:203 (+) Transcript_21724:781-1389(+)
MQSLAAATTLADLSVRVPSASRLVGGLSAFLLAAWAPSPWWTTTRRTYQLCCTAGATTSAISSEEATWNWNSRDPCQCLFHHAVSFWTWLQAPSTASGSWTPPRRCCLQTWVHRQHGVRHSFVCSEALRPTTLPCTPGPRRPCTVIVVSWLRGAPPWRKNCLEEATARGSWSCRNIPPRASRLSWSTSIATLASLTRGLQQS